MNKNVALGLGALTGVVSLIAMLRLVGGGWEGGLSVFSWVFILLAMVPWIGYSAYRARHGHLTPRAALAVLACCVAGLISVWAFTLGAVVALAFSLAAFVVIWIHDWPPKRAPSDDRFVRIEELTADERE